MRLQKLPDQFGSKARETGGHKISKTAIIRSLVRVFNQLDVDHTGVMDEDILTRRIWEAMERHKES